MKSYKKIIEEPRLIIEQDEDVSSPREDRNLGYFITISSHYNSPDKNSEIEAIVKATGQIADSLENHMERITESMKLIHETVLAIYPIVMYEHGDVGYSLGSKHGFDYSNNSFYIVTDKTAKELGTPHNRFEAVIKQEIEEYNKWLNGEVYRFTLYDEYGEGVESCGGFYDIENMREALSKEWKDEKLTDYLK